RSDALFDTSAEGHYPSGTTRANPGLNYIARIPGIGPGADLANASAAPELPDCGGSPVAAPQPLKPTSHRAEPPHGTRGQAGAPARRSHGEPSRARRSSAGGARHL